ncbi:hypothetical protein, partial [Enterobacter asburiae]|uniref:hypothetical protein n=1 Tax=Enterobacter asburiae TaxID=61645 RepID=UPI0030C73BF1
SSTVRSLRSVTCLRRADGSFQVTNNVDGKRNEKPEKERQGHAAPGRFSIGFALLMSFTKISRFPVLKSEVAKPDRT